MSGDTDEQLSILRGEMFKWQGADVGQVVR